MKDEFCKKNDLAACLANNECSAGEVEAVKADADLHGNNVNENVEFIKMRDSALSRSNSKNPCVGDDDDKLSN